MATDARSLQIKQSRKFWMRWRVRLGYPVAVIFLLLARPFPRSVVIGGLVAAFGLLVRGSAAGHLRKDEQLATTGPYAVTRNPLYLGSSLLAAGFIIAGYSLWAGLIVGLYFAVFYYAVIRNEEQDLRKNFGVQFEDYATRVPLFFPRPRARSDEVSIAKSPENSFSWPRYRRNREYQALLGAVAGLVAVWLRMWVRARYGY
ncbi:MAG TPA: isoprenylcysteine carboxylmethyltransferase family protein [Candidatus Acidoferrum sp.]|jgi:protein-S-isoprenylcysteine O-methyltransferase Ste14|nr:isoprenylcysteine carboxylmethyltransferase family protein [Candidatus Acidoferrum sp.]